MSRKERIDIEKEIESLAAGVSMTAKAIIHQKKLIDATAKATWETLSRRERPLFVKSLREDGYTQTEIGSMVGKSQSAISQYEKKFDLQNPKKDD
ncbi:helix-turn-helix domain-containing protein [Salmonella enterica]|nr:helix-turn-helix domain-containing protein [Salmonella enterica]